MDRYRIRLTHTVPPEILAAIGDVTVSFASLQYNVEQVIDFLLGDLQDGKKKAITAGQNFSELLRLLDSLYVHHEPKLMPYDDFRKLMKEVEDAASHRNRVNHSMMYMLNEQLYTFSYSKKKPGLGAQITSKYVTTEDLQAIVEQVQIASGIMLEVYFELHRTRGKRSG